MPKEITLEGVRAALADRVKKEGSQVKAASALGISQSYINDLLHGRRQFSDAVLEKLGIECRVTYFQTRSTSK